MSDLQSRIAQLSPEKRALLAQRLNLERQSPPAAEPLAIIGMACRFPGARSLDEFWELLIAGADAVTEVPADRWSNDAYFDPDPAAAGKVTTKWGGFIADVDRFDAAFFSISPREAAQMDPQQRLLLEVAWHALEHAGQEPARLAGSRTGVFVGAHSHSSDYALLQYARPDQIDAFSATGAAHNLLSGRLSYLLDLHGPSLVVDTACSSSLVAAHLACQSVRAGECDTALVGGVNLMLSPMFTVAASRMQMLAADGRCKTFDAAADGFTRAEGCGVLVIKRLSDAQANGDRVLALIRGSAINQDGHTNGITAPNGLAQRAVLTAALRNAGVEPAQIGYVEAHGTGTPLGDPIEVEALAAALGSGPPVLLGAVKSNVGHLEGAAGVAGLIKTTLCLQRGVIPSVVHFTRLNPHITLDGTRLQVARAATPWSGPGRFAAVSSFGWSGTNANVVLEEAPVAAPLPVPAVQAAHLVVLSSPFEVRLPELAQQWAAWSRTEAAADAGLPAIATEAVRGRAHHAVRAGIVAHSMADLQAQLARLAAGAPSPTTVVERITGSRGLVFVFPGQGSQWLGMGRELFNAEPVFRAAIERCQEAFSREVSWRLVDELHAGPATSHLSEIDVVQPTLFAIQVALAELWRAWGVVPDAVVGHSMGEVAAAHVAGALSLADAAAVICRRSLLLKRISGRGAMAVVELSMDDTAVAIRGFEDVLSIAVANSPRSTVISGETTALEAVMASLQARDVFCRQVKVDVASHSPQIDAIATELEAKLARLNPTAADIPFYSTVTGDPLDGRELGAGYWVRNLRQPVLFSTSVQQLAARGQSCFVEISPHPILLPAVEICLQAAGVHGLAIGSLRRDEEERGSLLAGLARLYVSGQAIDWRKHWTSFGGVRVDLPLTPFARERHWLPRDNSARSAARAGHPFLGARTLGSPVSGWSAEYGNSGTPAWTDWQIDGVNGVAPGVLLDATLSAAGEVGATTIAQFEIERPIINADGIEIEASATLEGNGAYAFALRSRRAGAWTTHVVAQLRGDSSRAELALVDRAHVVGPDLSAAQFYDRLDRAGVTIGAPLRVVDGFRGGESHAIATYRLAHRGGWTFSAPLAQACLDVASVAALAWSHGDECDLWQVSRIDEIRRYGRVDAQGSILASCRSDAADATIVLDIVVVGRDDQPCLELHGVSMARFAAAARGGATQGVDDWCFGITWQESPITSELTPPSGQFILVADRHGMGQALARRLVSDGIDVVTLPMDGDRPFVERLAPLLGSQTRAVVYLGAFDLPGCESTASERLEQEMLASITCAVQIAGTLASTDTSARLWIATRGGQPVDGALAQNGAPQAALWGLGRVVAEEHPDRWGGLIDLDPQGSLEQPANELAAELIGAAGERQVGYRGGRRFTPRLAPLSVLEKPCALRPDAAYLITGGLHGVGLAVARWMVQQGARRLILAARTQLPPRDQWLALDATTPLGARVLAVRQLESMGASIHTPALDVADERSVEDFFEGYRRAGYPALRGIVHAAVVIADGLLRDQTSQSFSAVMRPKVAGTLVMHRLARHEGVDFLALFSSLGAVIGQTGQANYAAANAFVDAMACYRRSQDLPAISINWAGWRQAGLGAMSAGARRTIAALNDAGVGSFTTAQGLDVFGRLLSSNATQAVVMPVDPALLRRSHWVAADPSLFAALIPFESSRPDRSAGGGAGFVDRLREEAPASRRHFFERFLAGQLAAVLRLSVDRVDATTPLGSLGLESLMALEFRDRLEAQLGLKLSATLVWNHPTIAALATHLALRLQVALEQEAVGDRQEAEAPSRPVGDALSSLAAVSDDDALRALTGDGQ